MTIEEKVKKLLELNHTRENLEQMCASIRDMIISGIAHLDDPPNNDYMSKIHEFLETTYNRLINEGIELQVEFYKTKLTEAEIDEIISMLSSKAWQKLHRLSKEQYKDNLEFGQRIFDEERAIFEPQLDAILESS